MASSRGPTGLSLPALLLRGPARTRFAKSVALSGHQERPQGPPSSFLNRASQVRVLPGAPAKQLQSSRHRFQPGALRSAEVASRIDGRTLRHSGYEISQRKRKRIEECFGWMKTVGGMRKTRHRGTERVGWMFVFTAAVYNLVRIRNLVAVP